MAYDPYLEERIDKVLRDNAVSFVSKKMMGGLCYMVDDKMCVGIIKDMLMCRVGPDQYDEHLSKEHVQEMAFTGRPMKGYLFVRADGYDMDVDLEYWVQQCLAYNPLAKASKRKRKK